MKMTVWKSLTLQKEPEAINGVFKIGLRRSLASLLKQVEIILYLIFVEFSGQTSKMKRHGSNMPAIIIKCSGAPSQYTDITFETLKQRFKPVYFTACTIEKLVIS